MADFTLHYTPGSTVGSLIPETDAAKQWLDQHVQSEPYQWLGPALVIEHRYIEAIVDGIRNEGMEIES